MKNYMLITGIAGRSFLTHKTLEGIFKITNPVFILRESWLSFRALYSFSVLIYDCGGFYAREM